MAIVAVLSIQETISGAFNSLYFSGDGYIALSGATAYGIPEGTYFDRRASKFLGVEESIWGSGRIGGRSDLGSGSYVIQNLDGAYDYLRTWQWENARISFYDADTTGEYYKGTGQLATQSFVPVLLRSVETAVVGDNIEIFLRDPIGTLDTPVQKKKYAGTGGAEGPEGLKDALKPLALGNMQFVEPVLVDEGRQIYQWSSETCCGVYAIYDSGNWVGPVAGEVFSYATLESVTVPDGFGAITYSAQGFFKLKTKPSGALRVQGYGLPIPTVTNGVMSVAQINPNPGPTSTAGYTFTGNGWSYQAGQGFVRASMVNGIAEVYTLLPASPNNELRYLIVGVTAYANSLNTPPTIFVNGQTIPLAGNSNGRTSVIVGPLAQANVGVRFEGGQGGRVFDIHAYWLASTPLEIAVAAIALASPKQWKAPNPGASTLQALRRYAGIIIRDETKATDLIDSVLSDVQGFWGFGRLLEFPEFGLFSAPGESTGEVRPTKLVERGDIKTKSFSIVRMPRRVQKQTVRVRTAIDPITNAQLAAGVPENQRYFHRGDGAEQVYRNPNWPADLADIDAQKFDSNFTDRNSGLLEAQRRIALHSPMRRIFRFTIENDWAVRKHDPLLLTHPRYGLENGVLCRILSIARSAEAPEMTLEVWT